MNTYKRKNEQGAISGSLITIISLSILFIGAGSVAIWGYVNYTEQKTNVQGKIDLAVAQAEKTQADKDEVNFDQRDKEPNRQFVGPDDYGRVTFMYPKTWSVYVAQDASSGGDYAAYLNPVSVPPVSAAQQYSLRVTILQQDYDQVVNTYEALVKKGDLSSSATSSNGNSGTRLDGNFTKDIRGSAVIYKIRDKTLVIRTDADTFKPDFENIIKTINFNT
jgi:hypothetical protein